MSSNRVPLEIVSIATSFSSRNGYCLILKEIGGQRKLQMIVGTSEAQALAVSLEKIITSRPLTHQFVQGVLNEFEIALKYTLIYKYEEGIFYAHAVFEDTFGNVKTIDCRPSDAICIALKMEKPILAVEEIFEDAVHKYLDVAEAPSAIASPLTLADMNITQLKKMLSEAIENEDFEQAESIQKELSTRKK